MLSCTKEGTHPSKKEGFSPKRIHSSKYKHVRMETLPTVQPSMTSSVHPFLDMSAGGQGRDAHPKRVGVSANKSLVLSMQVVPHPAPRRDNDRPFLHIPRQVWSSGNKALSGRLCFCYGGVPLSQRSRQKEGFGIRSLRQPSNVRRHRGDIWSGGNSPTFLFHLFCLLP